jgi:CheY-like chemotaxis protein
LDNKVDAYSAKPVEILLIDDSPSDTALTVEAFKNGKIANKLFSVADGVEAMAYLRQQGVYKNARRPDLIMLDLNLPKKDGRQLLTELKSDPELKVIPVIVLTTSRADEDIIKSYEYQANCFITKPVDFKSFSEIIRAIENFWLVVVTLPPRS